MNISGFEEVLIIEEKVEDMKVEDIIDRLLVRSSVLAIVEIFYPFGNGSAHLS